MLEVSKEIMKFNNTIDYARHLDDKDDLRKFRELFVTRDQDTIYAFDVREKK